MPVLPSPTRLALQPATAVAVMASASRPDGQAAAMARLVEIDPALSAAVLRFANAARIGTGRAVTSARQAAVLLGTRTVESLAVGGTAQLVFGPADRRRPSADPQHGAPGSTRGGVEAEPWTHAVATACATAAVARLSEGNPAEAFTAGLLHNAARFIAPLPHDPGCNPRESADLLARHEVPAAIVRAVRMQSASIEVLTDGLARTVSAGHAVAVAAAAPDDPGAAAVARSHLTALGLGPSRLGELLAAVRRDLDGVTAVLAEAGR
jgi:hypothetical protein